MTDELLPIEPVETVEPVAFEVTAELQAAVDAAMGEIEARSFAGRNPELGKMINCQFCGRRHRAIDNTYREIHDKDGKVGVQIMTVRGKCEQVFTSRIGDYELFREDEKGELVPDTRTAVRPLEKPTRNQQVGRAAFAKKRFHPHPSKVKLQFIERTRLVFELLGFALEAKEGQEPNEFKAEFDKNLQRARVVAARQLRRERRTSSRITRLRQETSRRINRGFSKASA